MVLITHDLSVVAELCDKIVVMYAGKVAERGSIYQVFENPRHPYTQALLWSIPRMEGEKTQLRFIPGSMPDLVEPVSACRFHGRCPHEQRVCKETEVEAGHTVACHFWRSIK
jgi:peptide/nickel transport system ATP-binding protein